MAELELHVSHDGVTTTIAAHLGGKPHKQIFYEFSHGANIVQDGIGNAALLAFLPYAMAHGFDLHVEGADADLLAQLEENQDAWVRWHPSIFRKIATRCGDVRSSALAPNQSAVAAFSGGLDATYALHAHKRGLLGRRNLDIKAGVLIQGFDLPLDKPQWFAEAKRRAEAILASYGTPLITVRTNWRSLRTPWEQTFIFGVASVLHQFKGVVAHGVIAADEAYDGEVLGWGSNSITNPMMSGASFPVRFTGAGATRSEKAEAVSREAVVLKNLRVCWERPDSLGNCGLCEKCIRTKLNFMAHGVDWVPALGDPVTPDQIRLIEISNEAVLNLFKELALHGWDGKSEIKRALASLTSEGVKEPVVPGRLVGFINKTCRSVRKRVPLLAGSRK